MILNTLSESGDNLICNDKNPLVLRLVELLDLLNFKLSVACDFRDYVNQKICPDDDDSELYEWNHLHATVNEFLIKLCSTDSNQTEPLITIPEFKEFCKIVYPVPEHIIDTFIESILNKRQP